MRPARPRIIDRILDYLRPGAVGWCIYCRRRFYVPHGRHMRDCRAYREHKRRNAARGIRLEGGDR